MQPGFGQFLREPNYLNPKRNVMKTFLPFKKTMLLVIAAISFGQSLMAQSELSNGLNFTNPQLRTASYTNKKVGAVYLFSNVGNGIDATVTVDSLVNGASIDEIDDNSQGTGYREAFQPAIKSGSRGASYAVFTVRFFQAGTTTPASIRTPVQNFFATPIDIDGNNSLHEFVRVHAGEGSLASYMSNTTSLSLSKLSTGYYYGVEVASIERGGIDTSSYANMFTVKNANIDSFKVAVGMVTTTNSSTSRQFSIYMKGIAIPNQITLPVELVNFAAILKDKSADLKWVTASERNVSHFVIEKSVDGKNYSDIGTVFAFGNTTETKNYNFTDNSINAVASGVFYYRLRSVDIDEKVQYSPVRIIRIAKQTEQAISIVTYPNPVSNEVRVTVPANWQGKKVSYQILDNHGRIIIKTEPTNSSQTETINVANLAPGIYMASVSCNGETATHKIVKR